MTKLFLGIDVSHGYCSVALLEPPQNGAVLPVPRITIMTVRNTQADYQDLMREIDRRCPTPSEVLAMVDYNGGRMLGVV